MTFVLCYNGGMPKRTDGNQREIMAGLRACGCVVVDTHTVGHGYPDINVLHHGRVYLVEVKARGGKLTPDEIAFRAQGWPVIVAYSVEDVLAGIDSVRPRTQAGG